ncbi:MAG: NAD(P)-dependent oxidoreductase [Bacteroidota bacterium]
MSMKVGFIGLGMMGEPMAGRLLAAGYTVVVHNRTRSKADELLSRGAKWEENPRHVAAASDVVITMLSTSEAVKDVSFRQDGVLAGLPVGGIHVDMSTVAPSATEHFSEEYQSRRRYFLHAPVLGSIPQAQEGSLLIFVGGDRSAFQRCQSIFDTLGKRVWCFDEVTRATYMKLVCNLFIASMITTLSEGLVLGKKAGLSPETILEVLRDSALNAPMYQSKGESICHRNFTPRFLLDHMLKDVNLILEACGRLSLELPMLSDIRGLFAAAKSKEMGTEDYSAVVKVME